MRESAVGHLREIYLRIECSLVAGKSFVRFANIVEQMCTQKPARCPLNAINGLLSAGQQCSLTCCRSVPLILACIWPRPCREARPAGGRLSCGSRCWSRWCRCCCDI